MTHSRIVDYCPTHGTPVGIYGCRICNRAQAVPMPQWFKDYMVALGLRPPAVTTPMQNHKNSTDDTDRADDHR